MHVWTDLISLSLFFFSFLPCSYSSGTSLPWCLPPASSPGRWMRARSKSSGCSTRTTRWRRSARVAVGEEEARDLRQGPCSSTLHWRLDWPRTIPPSSPRCHRCLRLGSANYLIIDRILAKIYLCIVLWCVINLHYYPVCRFIWIKSQNK